MGLALNRRTLTATAVLAVLLVAGSAFAGVVTQRYEFAEPTVKELDGYHSIRMDGAVHYGAPGAPVLPMFGARILLPPGEVVTDVTVVPGELIVLGDGFTVEPGQAQYPLSYEGPFETYGPDPEIYGIRGSYPDRMIDVPTVGTYRGYGIATAAMHPVQYEPSTGRLAYYASMDVVVTTAPDGDQGRMVVERVRKDDATLARLARKVDNPLDADAYQSITRAAPATRSLDPADAYKYIIVTTDSWDDYLDDLVDFETTMGHKAGVFLKNWISLNYSGIDEAEQIRNFIIDAYNTWDIDHVLLVGDARDANGIPHRGLYSTTDYGETDSDIPADLYYGALDGTWNSDGDSYWGEPGEDDLYPDVAVGRACVSTASDVQNFVTKVTRYINSPVIADSDEGLMVGELLWSSSNTYGGTYMEEIRLGSSSWGYTTVGMPLSTMNIDTLYDLNGTWSKSTLISLMENGMNFVNHLGHCSTTYAMKMTTSDIPSFDNDGTVHSYNFVYSQGCYGGAFDNRDTSPGSYVGDCFAEEFNVDEDGAVAEVMNSRYGWGYHGGTNGSSQYFHREFVDAMTGEGIYPLGEMNDDSKVDVIWNLNYGANRWVFYELNLFGDPAMHVWTASPTAMSVSHPSGMVVGQPDVTVNTGVAGAIVTAYYDDYSVYATGVTNGSGAVTLSPSPTVPGTLYIKAFAHDHLVYEGSLDVAPAAGPFVVYDSYVIDDDTSGESNGNGNLVVNAGETIELPVTLENVGTDPATNVRATLTTSNGHATILDDYEEFGGIPSDATATSSDDYTVQISGSAPDGEIVSFDLDIVSDDRMTWLSGFSVQVSAPALLYTDHEANDDPSNGNGCLEAGETFNLAVSMTNAGSATATNLTAALSTSDPYLIINDGSAGAPFINPGGTGEFGDFSLTLRPDCPEFYEIDIDVDITGDWGFTASTQVSILTAGGDFADDVEAGEGAWTHDNVTGGFTDEWHIDTYRSHTSSHSWKFGGSGSATYANSADGALYTQELCIGSGGEMTMWHWMAAEEESSTWAWDCGLVEITSNGGATWLTLVPNGGYSHQKNDNTANPLPEGTYCWSGSFNWTQETFDLSGFEGETVQIRFRFASDGYVTEEGWYVDDIQITSTGGGTGVDDPIVPMLFTLKQNAPNPFNPTTVIAYQLPQTADVTVEVYNIAGKLVRTLVDEEQDAGFRSVVWDGTNDEGMGVASGVYMYRLQAGDEVAQKRMVLLK